MIAWSWGPSKTGSVEQQPPDGSSRRRAAWLGGNRTASRSRVIRCGRKKKKYVVLFMQHQLASTIVGVVDDLEVHAVHVERVRRGPEVVHDQVQQRRARGARHVRRCSHRACSSGTSVNQRVTQRASPSARRGLAARHGIRCSKRSGG